MSEAEAHACRGTPAKLQLGSSGGEVPRAGREALAHAEKCRLPPGLEPPLLLSQRLRQPAPTCRLR